MELKLRDGDYVPDGVGGLRRVSGKEALVQRILFRLTARRGYFPFCENLGSRLWLLGQVSAAQRQTAAVQYVTEALAEESGLTVDSVTLAEREKGVMDLTAAMSCAGESFSITLKIQ
ncbi:hypothetical protein SAMN05216343_10461 [Oscillibacter sp. PC13]|uniref:hypothetical protein n=1 Tax=Oscillibacter sp. PC13 TaxID=1855299 RepID=UPI0008F1006C|nr:hypothetical protein [Oscillibacter sp. PC13]SFP19509.1 hypothetical protein SAMN05216343_10461 [Oscillibacter sp. PC13]